MSFSLRGVIDRLWNLGTIDESLEDAFSAVANSEAILVQHIEDAQEVVDFVRTNHLGRVTCIVLDHVTSELSGELRGLRKKKFPTASKLLLDLVTVPDQQYEVSSFDSFLTAHSQDLFPRYR